MKQFLSIRTALVALSIFFISCSPDYDLVIEDGIIYDGLGGAPYIANIAVKDGKIVKIGDFKADGLNVIDAKGFMVSPGFIDIHTHIDRGIVKPEGSSVQNYLTQGVTTVVTGNCGSGTWKVTNYFNRLDSIGIGPNVIHLVGHGTIRRSVMGQEDREPTAEELAEMKSLIAQGMQEGALGLSSGLFYAPGSFAKTEEVVDLARTVKEYQGIYASHIRDESNYTTGLVASIEEAIEIGEKAGVPVEISHIKALGVPVWGLAEEVCNIIEAAQERGVKVMADQYPYVASSTSLSAAVIPRWVQEGGKMKERLQDPDLLERIKKEAGENIIRRGGPESLLIVSYKPNHEYDGLSLAEISVLMDKPAVETAITLVLEASPSIVSFNMNKDDLAYFMKKDYVMTSSDGSVQIMGSGVPHPRSYGTFPHKIKKYVLEDSLISMEAAIRAATSLPAQMLGLTDRGQIREGNVADIVIFNARTISDKATFNDPHQYSEGIEYLLLHGEIVIEDEVYNNKLVGRTLRMNEYKN
ncbi:MAG: hypothetical protein DRI71_08870 [Bacteroidetes bacterium]|nr:MAG: hypothetical protein DRI71_08870 [Bacteroidota bacterium]